jgi:hypothetical protein
MVLGAERLWADASKAPVTRRAVKLNVMPTSHHDNLFFSIFSPPSFIFFTSLNKNPDGASVFDQFKCMNIFSI